MAEDQRRYLPCSPWYPSHAIRLEGQGTYPFCRYCALQVGYSAVSSYLDVDSATVVYALSFTLGCCVTPLILYMDPIFLCCRILLLHQLANQTIRAANAYPNVYLHWCRHVSSTKPAHSHGHRLIVHPNYSNMHG